MREHLWLAYIAQQQMMIQSIQCHSATEAVGIGKEPHQTLARMNINFVFE